MVVLVHSISIRGLDDLYCSTLTLISFVSLKTKELFILFYFSLLNTSILVI
jgi:hypothetical protein